MTTQFRGRVPVGAEVVEREGTHFRVWAPEHKSVEIVLASDQPRFCRLDKEYDSGYFSGFVQEAQPGALYKYRLDGADLFPDPASRFQPDGPHGYSQISDPNSFQWTDSNWPGVRLEGQVIYEMHIGTFTSEGTWKAAIEHLPYLADTGITVLEIMPVSEFPGRFGWGYDGVDLFAPSHLYGTPNDFRAFVDKAHGFGMGVILDVVYNHFGPDGNYVGAFSPYYFTNRHETDWGEAINFYGDHSAPVREFFIANAGYWISAFHLDGLRLDATQNIYDDSPDHILAAIAREVRKAAAHRHTIIVAENELQHTKLIRRPAQGGYGLDGLWNDDFHHAAMVRLTGRNEAYYSDYLGTPQEFVSAAKYGYLFQGQWYDWQHQRRGSSSRDCARSGFVNFIQNHDQVANSARGLRANTLTGPGLHKTMTALLLFSPGTPMLFQGEEFASSSPFLFFADQKLELAALVQEGRRKFLSQFRSLTIREMWGCLADPCDPETFQRSKLNHAERDLGFHAEIHALIRDALKLRREDPVLSRQGADGLDGAVLSPDALVLRYFDPEEDDRLVIVNFGRDLHLNPAPEPLLAPPENKEWDIIFSTEAPSYGGCGVPPADTVENWIVPGHATLVLKPVPRRRTSTPPEDPIAA